LFCCGLSIVHYSSLFQYFFYRSTIVPTLVENSSFFNILVIIKNIAILKFKYVITR